MARICVFTLKEDSSVCPRLIFSEQDNIIFVGLCIKVFNTPTCYPKYDWNIWLYSTLPEAEFNGTFFRTSTWLVKTHRSRSTFCIPSVIAANHKREWHLVQLLSPMDRQRTILASWIVLIKVIIIVSKKHMTKIWVEALISYSNLLNFFHLFVDALLLVKL